MQLLPFVYRRDLKMMNLWDWIAVEGSCSIRKSLSLISECLGLTRRLNWERVDKSWCQTNSTMQGPWSRKFRFRTTPLKIDGWISSKHPFVFLLGSQRSSESEYRGSWSQLLKLQKWQTFSWLSFYKICFYLIVGLHTIPQLQMR